jgi:hypothetical protein
MRVNAVAAQMSVGLWIVYRETFSGGGATIPPPRELSAKPCTCRIGIGRSQSGFSMQMKLIGGDSHLSRRDQPFVGNRDAVERPL